MEHYCMGTVVRKEIDGYIYFVCSSCGYCYSMNDFYAPLRCEREIKPKVNTTEQQTK